MQRTFRNNHEQTAAPAAGKARLPTTQLDTRSHTDPSAARIDSANQLADCQRTQRTRHEWSKVLGAELPESKFTAHASSDAVAYMDPVQ